MDVYISEDAVVVDIQEKFREFYPNLKLAFYRNPRHKGACAPKEELVPREMPVDKSWMMQISAGWMSADLPDFGAFSVA